jgi:DNA repair exonuclease SbcCD ATPase subunit
MECPGCGSYTSSVYRAFADGEPCPVCGLSHEATAELITIRDTVRVSRANDEVKAIAEDALRRAGKAEAEVETLRRQIAGVRAALESGGDTTLPWRKAATTA